MKLAFCLYRYFPFGGLQRDFLRIARICLQRGHEVHVYTGSWEGEQEPGLFIHLLTPRGWQNHSRCRSFSQQLSTCLKTEKYDLVVGFNKMPGLDVYYAADVCYQSRIKNSKPFWYRLLPRYRQYLKDERAVFSPQAQTQILILSPMQGEEYRRCYHLPEERFHLLPPGISPDRRAPENANEIRAEIRESFNIQNDENILLMVGSGFKTKGLDRLLLGLAALPTELRNKTQLWVIGQDQTAKFVQQARTLGLESHVHFLGGRHDVNRFFLAADFLVHPAYHENTGTVILEALVAGLPVLTVDVCGYAPYVHAAQAGIILPSPYHQKHFNLALQALLLSPLRKTWQQNGLAFAQLSDIYSLPEKASDFLEQASQSWATLNFKEFMQLQGQTYRTLEGRRTQRILIHNQTYFIKQHFGVGWKEIFKNLLQFKLPIISAKNEWQALQRLQELGVMTPKLKAYGRRGFNPARMQSFLLMEELKTMISLEDFCRHWKTQAPSVVLKRALIAKVASIAKTMHENGINHRDFYLCHFLLDPASLSKAQPDLYLIDLHRAGLRKKIARRWLIKDLAGLYFSSKNLGLTPRDYWRFIKLYRQEGIYDSISKEMRFWRQVVKCGEKLYHAHAVPR